MQLNPIDYDNTANKVEMFSQPEDSPAKQAYKEVTEKPT